MQVPPTCIQGQSLLQEQLQVSQEALKAAKAESGRRLKALQSLQQQGSEGPHLVANAAFLAEKAAREAADSKLATARRSLAHKDELIKSLNIKVSQLSAVIQAHQVLARIFCRHAGRKEVLQPDRSSTMSNGGCAKPL